MKQKFEELNLLDDFMMGTILNYPEIGPEICRKIVSIILGKKIKEIKIVPQKTYLGEDTDKHGIRLDVYAEESNSEGENTIYDLEPDKNRGYKSRNALPKRVRFYHSKIDAESLASGEDYACLKQVIIIFISPYDPFGLNRMVYTIKNSCIEEPDMPYDDGAKTIFLYTRGKEGNPPQDLQKLLHYLEDTKAENADNADLADIHKMVETVRRNKEVSWQYMKWVEIERFAIEEGIARGRAEGLAIGRSEGLEMGRSEGLEMGRTEGLAKTIYAIRHNIDRGISTTDIAEFLCVDLNYIETITRLIQEYPEEEDITLAKKLLDMEVK